mmetsp:Transcript_37152/g.105667  ORF Transcript_37152/g.105667 Transcript_37152/m.105667 type:complete len:404 (+) Transcript_37152:53-1264(+)
MPGAKGFAEAATWFEECFGFKELSYRETQKRFTFADGVLTSTVNQAKFHVGPFETPALSELEERLAAAGPPAVGDGALGRLTFRNITGSAKTLHLESKNAGGVFQVASQFNCLEMNEPGARPEDGVTRYYADATQGPACALACPAGTVYRNYFVNEGRGQGNKHQIDCLADVGALLRNEKEKYWRMANGYCLQDAPKGIAAVSGLIAANAELAAKVRGALRVGVHWDTEVKSGAHRVCQVFCSAMPVSYEKKARATDWAAFASELLISAYLSTLAVGAILARERRSRVTVFLTAVGGGAFGNRTTWVVQAMETALTAFAEEPLDVKLVHFATLPKGAYADLEKGRWAPKAAKAKASVVDEEPAEAQEGVEEAAPTVDGDEAAEVEECHGGAAAAADEATPADA